MIQFMLSRKRLGLILSFLLCHLYSNAQIGEWIADQIRSEIEAEVEKITSFNTNTLGTFGSYLWESIVSAKCESDLEDKAKELKNVEIDRSFLDRVPGKYPNRTLYWNNHSQLNSILNERANSYFHILHRVNLNKIANYKISEFVDAYIDSVSSHNKIVDIESVLSQQTIDSLQLFSNNIVIRESLLADIQKNPSIIVVLNLYPETIRVYANSIKAPSLRNQPKHLLYWAVTADSHRALLPKKQKLMNPRELSFVTNGAKTDILYNDRVVGQILSDKLVVFDINIMNFAGRPSTTYVFENNEWTTDTHGRVISAIQKRGKQYKKKCIQKSSVKVKPLVKALNDESLKEIGYFNLPEFGAPDVFLNVYAFSRSDFNKTAQKDLKKTLNNEIKKTGTHITTTKVNYCEADIFPSSITVDNYVIVSSGLSSFAPAPTTPDNVSFGGAKSVNNTVKTKIVTDVNVGSMTPVNAPTNVSNNKAKTTKTRKKK